MLIMLAASGRDRLNGPADAHNAGCFGVQLMLMMLAALAGLADAHDAAETA